MHLQSNRANQLKKSFIFVSQELKLELAKLKYFNPFMQTEATQSQIKNKSERTQQNQTIFSISLIVVQTLLSIMYGLYCQTPIQAPNLSSVLSAIFFAFLVVGGIFYWIIGFGLYFSYLKSLLWSGIAFSFMIIALSIQIYPLVNALWAKTHIHTNGIFSDSFRNKNFGLFLANMDSKLYQSNTIISAIKCALALIIAFGSVIGRVGPLECLIMTVFGIFIYEVNRSIIAKIGQDLFGTFSIFTFGGFLGLTFGIFLTFREKSRQALTWKHPLLIGASQNMSHVLIGGLLIFALFPFLAFQGDQSYASNLFQRYNTPVSIILSMGSAIYTSIGLSMLIYGDNFRSIRVKDVMNALIAGGIVNGAASSYITSPFLAITAGSISSIIQYAFDNLLQKRIYHKFGLVSTHSFTLFCLQGLLGAFFAEGFNKRIVNNNPNNGFTYNPNTIQSPGNQIVIYLISAGLGIACGIITGIPSYFLNNFKTEQLFNDKTSFRAQDGIHFHVKKQTPPPIVMQNNIKNQSKQVLQSIKEIEKKVEPHKNQFKQQEQIESSSSEISFDFLDMLQVVIQ